MARLVQVIVCIVLVGFSLISQTLSGKVSNETQLSLNKSRPHHRIAGGGNAHDGVFPSYAFFWFTNGTHESFCGAVLVNLRQLLTAAHCVRDKYNKFVRFKGNTRDKLNATYLPVVRACKHPKYSGKPNHEYDLAVLTLGGDVTTSKYIKQAKLCRNCEVPWRDLEPIATGFGMESDKPKPISTILGYLDMRWIYKPNKHESKQYLIPKEPGSICSGDSGSPVYAEINNRQILVGILSSKQSKGCLANSPVTTIIDLYNKKGEVLDLLAACKQK